MKITQRQADVLENLHRIVVTRGYRRTRYSLDGRDCRIQIIGLAVRGIVTWDGHGKPSKVSEPASVAVMRPAGAAPAP